MKISRPLQYINHQYNGKVFPEALMSGEGVNILFPSKQAPVEKMPFLNTLWDDKNFKNVNLPMQVGQLNTHEQHYFSYPNDLRVLDMPIKLAGSNQYKIPKEISQFLSIISKAACYEHAMNEKIEDYFCYITLDQKLVTKDTDTRKGGIHVDGFQGARIPQPLMLDHSYIIYDKFPTIFYNQEFEVLPGWDKTCHNYFEGFQEQAKKECQVTYSPYEILLINGYCLHEAPKAPTQEYRTFFRMSYTVREFDRLGNAHNPLFDYKWEMLPRNTQDSLVCPIKP
jgi:hypothetical protein